MFRELLVTCRKSVVSPVIDMISDVTFEYTSGFDTLVGGFDLQLNFLWKPISFTEMERRQNDRSASLRSVVNGNRCVFTNIEISVY